MNASRESPALRLRNAIVLTMPTLPDCGLPNSDDAPAVAWKWCAKILDRYQATYHLIGNHTGGWVGDEFQGGTYCVASHLHAYGGGMRKAESLSVSLQFLCEIVRAQIRRGGEFFDLFVEPLVSRHRDTPLAA